MKRLFLCLMIFVWFGAFSQTPKKAINLSNSLYDLWEKGKTEKAVASSLELYQLGGERLFVDRIHSELSQMLKKSKTNYELNYLEALYSKKNSAMNQLITPIYLWGKSLAENDAKKLNTIAQECENLLATAPQKALAERYMLLIIKELDKKQATDKLQLQKFIEKTNNSLQIGLSKVENDMGADREKSIQRAWYRYLLSEANFMLYNLTDGVDYLKKASNFSPDILDLYNQQAYFYDADLLTGNVEKIGYKSFYKDYLIQKNEQKEVLLLLSEIYLNNPSEKNRQELENYYKNVPNEISFEKYWENYINTKGTEAPKVKISFPNEVLDLTKPRNNWVFIDVWGTWCAPCVKDLPKLQQFYTENQNSANTNLKIYTFSYNSVKLDEFMTKKGYNFPVIAVDDEIIKTFSVQGFPTKILITPQNKFIKIPYVPDWEKYIKGYIITDK